MRRLTFQASFLIAPPDRKGESKLLLAGFARSVAHVVECIPRKQAPDKSGLPRGLVDVKNFQVQSLRESMLGFIPKNLMIGSSTDLFSRTSSRVTPLPAITASLETVLPRVLRVVLEHHSSTTDSVTLVECAMVEVAPWLQAPPSSSFYPWTKWLHMCTAHFFKKLLCTKNLKLAWNFERCRQGGTSIHACTWIARPIQGQDGDCERTYK